MMLAKIIAQSHMAADPEFVQRNILENLARDLPEFHNSHYWQRFKGEHALAIIGGGPSLSDTIGKIKEFRHTMVCGSAHDHITSQGIEPEFCVVLDSDPITANYLQRPCETTTYFVSSNCGPEVFDALKNHQILLWHCAGTVNDELVPPKHKIGGGCTVTLRAIGIAMLMGYGNQHFFGFDSCNRGDQHHAYRAEDIDDAIDVRMPGSDRIYQCAPYHLAQAQQFQDILRRYGHLITPTIHGDGLISEIMRMGQQESAA